MSRCVIAFADPLGRDISLAGGKGANLAVLSGAGLPVPPGFCVTTEAYGTFAAAIGLDSRVARMLSIMGDDADSIEKLTAQLRDFIINSPIPEPVARAVLEAYSALEPDCYVAVRSSGTAEDLAGASFAGLHDTYLDIRGSAALLDAVKRCWASMWTARATFYRRSKGFDQEAAKIAVVVQQMVKADVAGVMFTANPMTGATDEIVINAAYGLGEALVSGIATPDEHVLSLASLKVREQRVGAKEVRVVRDPTRSFGTITEAVPKDAQERLALSEPQLTELGQLGQRVMALYRGFPQDIEWALARNRLYILQARPITGVELSWDEQLEYWQSRPDDAETLWTRSWADEVWNGAISPLTYSYRGHMFTEAARRCARLVGIPGGLKTRVFKFYRSEAYFNTAVDRLFVEHTALPRFRPALLAHTSPEAKEAILRAPFGLLRYLRMHAHIIALGYGPYKWFRIAEDYLANRIEEANGSRPEELEKLSDQALRNEMERIVGLKVQFNIDLWTGFFIYARDAVSFLGALVSRWYDGSNPSVLADLFSGLPRRTATVEENLELWRLAERIRNSRPLLNAFHSFGVRYIEAFEAMPEGRRFLTDYRRFAAANAHRGHADRDPYFERRADDPLIDYENFRLMLSASGQIAPEAREQQVNDRRNSAIADLESNLRRKSFGRLRVLLLRYVLAYVYRFFYIRDNQRHYFDRYTYAVRRNALEIGRRLTTKGILRHPDDAFFLGRQELYALLAGDLSDALLSEKLVSRRRHFERMRTKQANPPAYLRRGRPVSFAAQSAGTDGVFPCIGTSRGMVTARARIVMDLRDIGRVMEGEILVTQSTDPGWTPVFNLIKGIVLETGGMLAHGSCLAREYGFPAVQLASATKLIPDGALIKIDADAGLIAIQEETRTDNDSTNRSADGPARAAETH